MKGGCIGKAELQNDDDNEEVETQWNESGVGPAGYVPNYELVEKSVVHNVWKKEPRWKEEKPVIKTELKDEEI